MKKKIVIYSALSIISFIVVGSIGYFILLLNNDGADVLQKKYGKKIAMCGNLISDKLGMQKDNTLWNKEDIRELSDKLDNRVLVFYDEFNENKLNDKYWKIDKNFNRSNELQLYYQDNVILEDGVVKIIAKRENSNAEYQWTSGELSTQGKLAFQNCRMEARIRMDNEVGFCPAFWTLGDTISGWNWPRCGEIDIFEAPNKDRVNCNTHFANPNNEHSSWGTSQKDNVDLSEWHIYAMEINDGIITIYLDGEQIDWFDTSQKEYYDRVNPFTQAMYPIFNIAVGGDGSNGSPADDIIEVSMEIDWFRVYANEGKTEQDIVPQSFEMKYLGNGNHYENQKIKVGESVQLFPVYTPQSSIQGGIKSCKVEDETICSCESGYITGIKVGKTTIIIVDNNGLRESITIEVIGNE